jgi:hypothetical protein
MTDKRFARWVQGWCLLLLSTCAVGHAESTQIPPRKIVGLLSASPAFRLNIATHCGFLTDWLLGEDACARTYVVPLRVDQETLRGALEPRVVLREPQYAIAPDALEARLVGDQLILAVNGAQLRPGRYSGVVVTSFAPPTEPFETPLEVQVRAAALWPVLIVAFGILVGRLVRYMNEKGNALATLRGRHDSLMAKSSRLQAASQHAMRSYGTESLAAIDDRDIERATAWIDKAQRALGILEELERVAAHPQFEARDNGSSVVIQSAVQLGEFNSADAALQELRRRLQAAGVGQPQSEGAQGEPRQPPLPKPSRGQVVRAKASKLRALFITRWARPSLYSILLVILVLTGLETLYVPAPTLGAHPIADYLTLFAWGLTADVASRTLANFRAGTS